MLVRFDPVVLTLNWHVLHKLSSNRNFTCWILFNHRTCGNNFASWCDFVWNYKTLILLLSLICCVNRFRAGRSYCFSLGGLDLVNCNDFVAKSFFITLNKLVGSLCCCSSMLSQGLCECALATSVPGLVLVRNILNVPLLTQNAQQFILWLLLSWSLSLFTLLQLVLLKYQVHTLLLRVRRILNFCGCNNLLLLWTFN